VQQSSALLTSRRSYGSFIFWLTGLAYNDGASIANYFMFLLLLFITSLSAGLLFGVLAAMVSVVSMAQASMAFVVVILILFSGFTVQPDVIPVYVARGWASSFPVFSAFQDSKSHYCALPVDGHSYYYWLYWLNFVAWILRSLVVNQFDSGKYSGPSHVPGLTEGEAILTQFGFVDSSGQPFTFVWAWYGILFTFGMALMAICMTSMLYNRMRFATGKSLVIDKGSDEIEELNENDIVEMPFMRVDLTFKDIHYTVKSSVSKEKLELLKGVDGVVRAGEMTALMGSSGAGE
jgi:ABC-type multidrug transport system fused ATPase/permease subunit